MLTLEEHNLFFKRDKKLLKSCFSCKTFKLGLSTCILGWLDSEKIENICSLSGTARLVITLGYARDGDLLRDKKRKDIEELVKFLG